ncbi:hypothetical protein [Bdellovibrio sp. HCB337]|uniref:hypothetical protein n=1 Tax=Bdellovibrio sp. HCB337 TaxID=3394358 RepID=UPI0039A767D1
MTPRRFYALDILRSCAILVVTFYHVWESQFGQAKMLFTPDQSFFGLLTNFFLDYWGYSGLILAFISFFLIGFSQTKWNWQRYLLVAVGFIGMLVNIGFDPADSSTWSWNIYAYLFVSLCIVQFIPSNKIVLGALSILSLLSLAVPIHEYQSLRPFFGETLSQIFIGDLDPNETIGWGLIPWLSIPILGFCAGRWLRQLPQDSSVYQGRNWELPALLSVAALLVVAFPFNDGISITATGFYYYVFSGTPWFFWSRFVVILIWLRISWLDSVNAFLGRFQFVRWLSNLSWNRHFGLAYFLEFAFTPLGLQYTDTFVEHPRTLDLFWIFILVATEFSTRYIVKTFKRISLKRKEAAS